MSWQLKQGLPLPDFEDYVLPPFDYCLTLEQLHASRLVVGSRSKSGWSVEQRGLLVNNLSILVKQLWQVGIEEIFVNGSFVEDKDYPNDIDGYFVCDESDIRTGRLVKELNALDPHGVWTWNRRDRRPAKGFTKLQLPMWHRYRVELYPHYGQGTGILREGLEWLFPAAFRHRREDAKPKGIVKIIR